MREVKAADAEFLWRTRLYTRLRGNAYPLLVTDGGITPAAALWAGTRLWTAAFREAGLKPGDRVILALPPSAGFLGAMLAGLWNGLTLAFLKPGVDVDDAARFLDTSASIGPTATDVHWQADQSGLPSRTNRPLRRPEKPPTPDVRFLLSTSGTTTAPRWIALSDANLFAVIDSHSPHLGLAGGRLLSVLPWHHAFGLVIELLPALLAGAEIIRDEAGGRDAERLVALMAMHAITHLNGVPQTFARLLHTAGGRQAMTSLRGGVVGGAPIGAALASALGGTRLRVGYGQTEASPGIALGAPGCWAAGYLGQPLGCAVEVADEGMLRFSGPNACLGIWQETGLERLSPHRWVTTGDLVRSEGRDLYFAARADDEFKLSNGRRIQAGLLESILKTRSPQVLQALLYSPDGDHLELLVGLAPNTASLSVSRAREALGSLGSRLQAIREMPPEQWVPTAKGEIDRKLMLEGLCKD